MVLTFVVGDVLIRVQKKPELFSFKTLEEVRSGSFKIIFIGIASQSFTGCAGMQNYSHTLRYNITNFTISASYNVTARYANYDLTIKLLSINVNF